jgi:uncharacterized protein (TIGR03067 family)
MRAGLCGTVLVCGIVAAAAVAADEPGDDLAALKGDWKVAQALQGGSGAFLKPFSKGGKAADAVQVEGDKLRFLLGKDKLSEFSVKLDPSKSPPTIDLVSGKDTYLGIYELKGDTLRLCFVEGKERPTDIKGTKYNSVVALTLKRSK